MMVVRIRRSTMRRITNTNHNKKSDNRTKHEHKNTTTGAIRRKWLYNEINRINTHDIDTHDEDTP